MSPSPLFCDRVDAGEKLAQLVVSEFNRAEIGSKTIVYALPRGGLPVAAPIARLLKCPLDVILAKKITLPENPELAIGAVTADGHVLWSAQRGIRRLDFKLRETALLQAQTKAQDQLADLAPAQPGVSAQGAIAILVDDGIATGMTMATAAQALRAQQPAAIWICAPVAPPDLLESLHEWGDHVILLATPQPFLSVSRFYVEFPQVEMAEALICLQQHHAWLSDP
ncbi:phosphoribosyltransferase [Microcoleus sp. FACHB-672]|uniref:phosphoribosyltransferase n=1 Tax=Microcoleus sp. FACHB-672 TaxID=2692825 RepID=UPI001688634D|nr:phosphoribosyltransferase family protein [Microcoleus sp. FACHB-672]MBD2042048.1 phosphoribosyltransferase [Microcoleus sp. FACHB-672]